MLLPHTLPQTIAYSRLLSDSYRRITGNHLVEAADDAALARALYEAPFVLVSHDTQADPVFRYANLAAQELWGYDWDEFTCLPSRLSAEAPLREERERLLAEAKRQGFVNNYQGIRIAKDGHRFFIKDTLLWNVTDENGITHGQAAVFAVWEAV